MRNNARDFLSPEDIKNLKQVSNWAGTRALLVNWSIIFAAFALAALLPHPLVILAVVVVLGSRQLALSIIMHEAAHRSLFADSKVNDFCGQWFGAAAVFQDMLCYRRHHMGHHKYTGTKQDPDLRLADGYPVTRRSLTRKFFRDVIGLTGVKAFLGSVAMLARYWSYNVSGEAPTRFQPERPKLQQFRDAMIGLFPTTASNLIIFGFCWLAGQPWLYLLWVAAWLTSYQVVMRIRSIAEHAMTTDANDGLNNARTTYGRWWERFFVAPLNVNYHLEHHLLPAVPYNQLPAMHRRLREMGAFNHPAAIEMNYQQILRQAGSAA